MKPYSIMSFVHVCLLFTQVDATLPVPLVVGVVVVVVISTALISCLFVQQFRARNSTKA